jgi:hypothetical protein
LEVHKLADVLEPILGVKQVLVVLFHLSAQVGMIFAPRVKLFNHPDGLGLVQIKLEMS